MTAYLGQIGLADTRDAIICCEPYPLSIGLKWMYQGKICTAIIHSKVIIEPLHGKHSG